VVSAWLAIKVECRISPGDIGVYQDRPMQIDLETRFALFSPTAI